MGIRLCPSICLPICRHRKKVIIFMVVTSVFTLFLLVLEDILFLSPPEVISKQIKLGLSSPGFVMVGDSNHLPNQLFQGQRTKDMHSPWRQNPTVEVHPLWHSAHTARVHSESNGPIAGVQSESRCPKWMVPKKCVIYNKIIHNFTIQKSDMRDDLINLHRYDYVIDSTACQRESPEVVMLVHSKFDHYQRRKVIRSTWAHNRKVQDSLT